MKYHNLRLLSTYSKFESIIQPKSLGLLNETYIGMCDRMNLCGAVEFSKLYIKNKFKPILGCLVNISNYGYLALYISNEVGYRKLSYILSQIYIRKGNQAFLEEFTDIEGIICLTGGEDSIFYQSGDMQLLEERLTQLQKVFGINNVFIEIQNIKNKEIVLALAFNTNTPIVIISPVYFLKENQAESLYVFHKIKDNARYFADEFENWPLKSYYFKDTEQIKKEFAFLGDALEEGILNTELVAKKCSFIIKSHSPRIPIAFDKYEIDIEMNDYAKSFLLKYENSNEATKVIALKIIEGLYIRNAQDKENYWKRVNEELEVLTEKNFVVYFLLTSDFCQYAIDNNIPIGPGRGSGAGSLIAYCLNITHIDPIAYGLIFERFLNRERSSLPDFDIDFCTIRRQEVIDYLHKKYGEYNVANIITFGSFQARGALGDVSRVFGLPFGIRKVLANSIPINPVSPVKLSEAIKIPQVKKYQIEYPKIFEIALTLEKLVRNYSQHAAGVVICDTPIYDICPLIQDSNNLVTQFNLADLEYVGGVKFDFLGLRTLTILDKTIKQTQIKNLYHIPLDDIQTFQLFRNGDLEGVFQFEGNLLIDIIKKIKPTTFKELIDINALARPGPLKSIPSYIARKEKKEAITYLDSLVEPILKDTYGIIVYQEQVMEIARVCAGYSFAEADLLRRAMGKKKPEEMTKHKNIFISGMIKRGGKKEAAEQLFELMNEFSSYGFNKSHAAPYSLIGYYCAYLKTHYIREFINSCINEEIKESIVNYIFALRVKKIVVLPPCVNYSEAIFVIENENVRFGLAAIKSISMDIAIQIAKHKPYNNIYDFCNKNKNILNKKVWEGLVYSGSLDIFNISRQYLSENFASILGDEHILEANKSITFFLDEAKMEHKVFGFYFNFPMKKIRSTLKDLNICLLESNNNSMLVIVEIISITLRIVKNTGATYAFTCIADESVIKTVVIRENLLNEKPEIFKEGEILVLKLSKGTIIGI